MEVMEGDVVEIADMESFKDDKDAITVYIAYSIYYIHSNIIVE